MTRPNVKFNVSGRLGSLGYEIFNVIDNSNETDAHKCNCCFATNDGTTNGWLQLDLSRKYLVYQIRVIGRSDCK